MKFLGNRQSFYLQEIITTVILHLIVSCLVCVTESTSNNYLAYHYGEENYTDPFYKDLSSRKGNNIPLDQNEEYESPEPRRNYNYDNVDVGKEINLSTDEKDNLSDVRDDHEDSFESTENTTPDRESSEEADDYISGPVRSRGSNHQDTTTAKSFYNFGYHDKETSKDAISSSIDGIPEKIKEETCCPKGERGQRGRRGYQGDPGRPGLAGLPGLSIEGQKGEKGEPCLFDYAAWAAENKEQKQAHRRDTAVPKKPETLATEGHLKRAPYEIVPGAIMFKTRASMIHMTEFSHIGTVIFIEDEEKYFGRVAKGWKEIMMVGEVVTMPFKDSSKLASNEDISKTRESDWVSRNRRTLNKRRNKQIKPHIKIAALNDPWNGDLHGIRGADHKCSSEAKNANISGNFRAFLSYDTRSLKDLMKLTDRNLPIFNLRGQHIFRSWNYIFENSGILAKIPFIYSFNGSNILLDSHWPVKRIWHGAKLNAQDTGKFSNCKSWNSDRFYNDGLVSDLLLDGHLLLSQQKFDCRQRLIVLCIETSRTEMTNNVY